MNGDFVPSIETEVTEYPSDIEVAEDILAGKPATLYHLVESAEHIDSIIQSGFDGSFRINQDNKQPLLDSEGRTIPITSFILTLRDVDFNRLPMDRLIKLEINQEGEPLKIFDGREIEGYVPKLELWNAGYNGVIRKAGAITPLKHQYEFTIFGREYGKKIQRVIQP